MLFGSQTFVPISWSCKKQTAVSHGSTEAEIVPFDSGLGMDGIPALCTSSSERPAAMSENKANPRNKLDTTVSLAISIFF